MAEPAYVAIAGELSRLIRSGALRPGSQLASHPELAKQHGVSEIVIRKAVALLLSQGLVRTIERRGTFVADQPTLTRVSPERQLETAETSFTNELGRTVEVERDTWQVPATDALAEIFGINIGDEVTHVVTRAREDGRPISISDTYQPIDRAQLVPTVLEETIADRVPVSEHAQWLGTPTGELVETVHQVFVAGDGRVVMVADISYPRDRYDAFVFRMTLQPEPQTT